MMQSLKLTLLSQYECQSMVLPEKCAGHYWIQGRDAFGKLGDIVAVEARQDPEDDQTPQWCVQSNSRFKVVDRSGPTQSVAIKPMSLYLIESTDKKLSFALYVEPLDDNRRSYCAYELGPGTVTLSIGRNTDNNIAYRSRFVSDHHAKLTVSENGITIQDLGSSNHTYVNGKAVQTAALKNGDVIYIVGLQIVVTKRFIFLNDPDGEVQIQSGCLKARQPSRPLAPSVASEYEDEYDNDLTDYYYRQPRFKHDVDTFKLKLDAPPSNQNQDEMPMIMVVGPSMTMGMASIATGSFAVVNAMAQNNISAAIPSIIMSVSMLLGTLLWPLITRTYQRRQRRRKEARRQETYQQYLEEMEKLISDESIRQEQLMRENALDSDACMAEVLRPNPQIWERTRKHTDFLSIRLGLGSLPLKADIQSPERKFSMEKDNLEEALYQFGERKRRLSDVPICLSLTDQYISGFYGERGVLMAVAKSFILQIIALHGYDEVKIALICSESDMEEFSFLRYLPASMNQERTIRYIATNSDEIKVLSSALDIVIERRKAMSADVLADESPYYVVVCLDKELATKAECVRRIQEYKENLRFSVVSFATCLQDLPKECSAVVELQNEREGRMTIIHDISDPPISFRLDAPIGKDIQQIAMTLANMEIDVSGSSFALPRKYTFFEMLNVGMVEHLNLLELWKTNDPTQSLAAPIGIDQYGEIFKLDLHERAHGPHGLVAGMTGSGKSEMIITYILSMAVHFHPYEVAFILIDYKGGGMAQPFANIPHAAGIITNLEKNGIQRALASMNSELHRRERIFQQTSQQYHISNIDIYKYQKLYREGKVSEPLPHLFVISDEFAELKKDQPEFMSELTSAARVGRSLGVHLILATQKPGGVVDDQIRSNSRFRLCLKVQEAGDSTEMLGRPEAAALVETGRFYLQVGYNEIFELGQSAWSGAPYYPSQKVVREKDDALSAIDTSGRVIAEANVDRFAHIKDPSKQLDVVTRHIQAVSESEGIKQWKMWLPPIPAKIYVDDLAKKYPNSRSSSDRFFLEPIIGEYDDPAHQAQGLLRMPITADGNVIIYGSAGSGKVMLLEAMCVSLMQEHSPQEVNLYLLDFGAESLTVFSGAPHVGDVVLPNETEKVERLFQFLLTTLNTRKKLLSRFGGDILQYNTQSREPLPSLVVVINNYAAFMELFEEKSTEVNFLTREGTKYGIYFILTCTGANNVRLNLRQNFKSIFCLQMNQADDYTTLLGKTGGLSPANHKGRGLLAYGKNGILEFQTASVTPEELSSPFIQAFVKKLARDHSGARASGVPVLPERVTADFLAPYVTAGGLGRVPIGVDKRSLEIAYWDFTQKPVNLLLAANQEWQGFVRELCGQISGRGGVRTMIFAPSRKAAWRSSPGDAGVRVFGDGKECVQGVREVFQLMLQRNNQYKDAVSEGKTPPVFEPLFIVVESISQLRSTLEKYKGADEEKAADDDTPLNRLQVAMEKCDSAYGISFLIAESVNGISPFAVEEWYKTHINGSDGIWVGSGISSQYRISVHKKPAEADQDLGPEFGFSIKNGVAALVKLLQPGAEEETA